MAWKSTDSALTEDPHDLADVEFLHEAAEDRHLDEDLDRRLDYWDDAEGFLEEVSELAEDEDIRF